MAQCVRWYLIIINSGRTKKPENCLNIKGMLGLAKEWAEQPHANRGCFEVSGLWSLKLRLLQPEETATVFSPSIPARTSHLLFYVIHCLLSLLIQLKSEQVRKSLAVESKPMELHLGPPQGSEMPEKYPDDLPEPCCLVPQAGQDARALKNRLIHAPAHLPWVAELCRASVSFQHSAPCWFYTPVTQPSAMLLQHAEATGSSLLGSEFVKEFSSFSRQSCQSARQGHRAPCPHGSHVAGPAPLALWCGSILGPVAWWGQPFQTDISAPPFSSAPSVSLGVVRR